MAPSSQEDLTTETTKKILDAFSKGQKPKPGPQSGRQTSENSAGLTALSSKVCFCILGSALVVSQSIQPYGPGEFCTPEFS
jgi:NADH dehydrogenase (ubiquinone) flavoprotein 2